VMELRKGLAVDLAVFEVLASEATFGKTYSLEPPAIGFTVSFPSVALFVREQVTSDVTRLYGSGRGKKRFWAAARARDAREKWT